MNNKNSPCKINLLVSGLALATSAFACFHSKNSVQSNPPVTDEKIKSILFDAIKQDPQFLMDSMNEGMMRKREDAIKNLSSEISKRSTEISKQSLQFGKLTSKVSLTCFFDPLCKHCIEFLKSMVKLIGSKKDACFKLIPVAVLGDDSFVLAKLFIAAYGKNPQKALSFIDKITSLDGEMDKQIIEDALKFAGFDVAEIEKMLPDAEKSLANNGALAESLGIPIVPAIFISKNGMTSMLQAVELNQLLSEIEKGPEKIK
ncbi:MAG: thioredoxin domain-containing protein [Holosporales bacterium]|jgi:protein-disulfide isomerase|nr:thioredoxin domain-containing protein [Holosporales bacterium]